jgi:hypothetical protein
MRRHVGVNDVFCALSPYTRIEKRDHFSGFLLSQNVYLAKKGFSMYIYKLKIVGRTVTSIITCKYTCSLF